jgi:hypothetical protein
MAIEDMEIAAHDEIGKAGIALNGMKNNLREMLPGGVNLGTPSVIEGQDYAVRICGGRVINHTVFATDAGPFSIRLIEDASLSRGASCAS